ncbi:MAG: hypothetical protein WA160_01095 [Pseudobdellovibrio sp.]
MGFLTSSQTMSADTRYRKGAIGKKKLTGVGRGRIYLYSNEAGVLKAMSYGFADSKLQKQDDERHFVMARPVLPKK